MTACIRGFGVGWGGCAPAWPLRTRSWKNWRASCLLANLRAGQCRAAQRGMPGCVRAAARGHARKCCTAEASSTCSGRCVRSAACMCGTPVHPRGATCLFSTGPAPARRLQRSGASTSRVSTSGMSTSGCIKLAVQAPAGSCAAKRPVSAASAAVHTRPPERRWHALPRLQQLHQCAPSCGGGSGGTASSRDLSQDRQLLLAHVTGEICAAASHGQLRCGDSHR